MVEIIELPATARAATLRRASARLSEGSHMLRQLGSTLEDQTAALGAVRAKLLEQVALTDDIAALAEQIEDALARGDAAALDTLQAQIRALMALEFAAPSSDAAD
jgi:hypothetical protein